VIVGVERGSQLVEHFVAVSFACFQPVAQIRQFVLHGTSHVVDRDAQVANQPFKFKHIQRNNFDLATFLSRLEGMLELFEWT